MDNKIPRCIIPWFLIKLQLNNAFQYCTIPIKICETISSIITRRNVIIKQRVYEKLGRSRSMDEERSRPNDLYIDRMISRDGFPISFDFLRGGIQEKGDTFLKIDGLGWKSIARKPEVKIVSHRSRHAKSFHCFLLPFSVNYWFNDEREIKSILLIRKGGGMSENCGYKVNSCKFVSEFTCERFVSRKVWMIEDARIKKILLSNIIVWGILNFIEFVYIYVYNFLLHVFSIVINNI